MSLSEKVQQLNREIGSSFERAIADMRQEVSQWLRSSSEDLLGRLAELRPEVPGSFVAHDDLEPAVRSEAEGLSHQARRGGVSELRDALGAIDQARSQAEILNALLRESGRYASRAAVLLLRGGEVRGWSGHGFGGDDAAIRELNLGAPQEGPWSHAFQGQGPARLSAAECAALSSRLESAVPQEGVLVPLVLRDRVAAALYADSTDGSLSVEALQILSYTAALAIESLPFRERASTSTLVPLQPEAAPEPPQAETAEEAPAPEPAPAEEESAAAPAEEPAAMEAAPETALDATEPTRSWTPEAAPEEVSDDTLGAEALPVSAGWESPAATTSDVQVEPMEEAEVEAEPWAAVEEAETYELETVDDTAAEPVTGWSEPAAEGTEATEDTPTPTQKVDLRGVPSLEPSLEEPAPEPEAPAASPQATVLLQRSSLREAIPPAEPERPLTQPTPIRPVPPPPPAQAEDAPPAASATPEVRPPSDVQGPGWAFAGGRQPAATEEPLHEEARRLARLLVSEIKLYNEEQVEEGRRRRDLYERLKEDIDRSRQMYEERVEPRILKTTDYFYQELVRILAAGDTKALGI